MRLNCLSTGFGGELVCTLINHGIVWNSWIPISRWTFLNSWSGSMPWIWSVDFAHGVMDIYLVLCWKSWNGQANMAVFTSMTQSTKTQNQKWSRLWLDIIRLQPCRVSVFDVKRIKVTKTRCNHMTIDKRRTRNLKRVWNIQEMCLVCEEGEWKYESTVNSWCGSNCVLSGFP
jgi:hypothetical protein